MKQIHHRFFQNESYKEALFLCLIVFLAIILRLIFRTGLNNPDSYLYLIGAINLNNLGLDSYLSDLSLATSRFSITIPLAIVLSLFGYSETTFAILPFMLSILSILTAFCLGKLINMRTGLIAALLVATSPQDIGLATAILPDSFIPFYSSTALLFLATGLKKDQARFLFLSGIFLTMSFESRTTSIILLPAILLIPLLSKFRTWRAVVLPTATFAVTIILLWVFLFFAVGDPFIQIKSQANVVSTNYSIDLEGLFLYTHKVLGRINFNFGFLIHLAFLALIIGVVLFRKYEKFHLPVITFVIIALYWEVGVTLSKSLVDILKIDRYLTILTIPAALLVAVTFDHLMTQWQTKLKLGLFALLALQIFLAILMVLVIGWPTTQGITYKNAVYKRVIQRLDQFDTNTVGVVNFRWIIRGTVYAWLENSEYEFIDLQNIKEEDLHPGTIIIYDPTYFTDIGERRENREEFPALAGLPERIPENWMLLFEDHHFLYDRQSVYVYAVSD